MNKVFLKKGQVELINGGFVSDKEGNPVSNTEFLVAQEAAAYVIKFAELAKGKDFKGKKADSVSDLREQVLLAMSSKDTVYVDAPKKPASTVTDKLQKEALSFIDFGQEKDKVSKVNNYLQKFNVINDFESHGLFFEQGINKLEKIYTIEEITEAVKNVIDLV